MNNGNIRKEMKYIINKEISKNLIEEINNYVKPSDFFFQRIHNVYYDNDYYGVISRSKNSSEFKEKLRIRTYEMPSGFVKDAYVELKKKFKGITYKRRIKLKLNIVEEMFEKNDLFPVMPDGQIKQEVVYFQQKTKCFPKVYISYNRHAYVCSDGSDMRITFDSDIFTREKNLSLKTNEEDILFGHEELVIMEVKVNGSMPIWFTNVLNKYSICPTSYSKYAKIIASDILELDID